MVCLGTCQAITKSQRRDFELRGEMQTILEPQTLVGTGLQDLMREMLVRLGEDPERDGLRDTPERMKRSMQYLTKATKRTWRRFCWARCST